MGQATAISGPAKRRAFDAEKRLFIEYSWSLNYCTVMFAGAPAIQATLT